MKGEIKMKIMANYNNPYQSTKQQAFGMNQNVKKYLTEMDVPLKWAKNNFVNLGDQRINVADYLKRKQVPSEVLDRIKIDFEFVQGVKDDLTKMGVHPKVVNYFTEIGVPLGVVEKFFEREGSQCINDEVASYLKRNKVSPEALSNFMHYQNKSSKYNVVFRAVNDGLKQHLEVNYTPTGIYKDWIQKSPVPSMEKGYKSTDEFINRLAFIAMHN